MSKKERSEYVRLFGDVIVSFSRLEERLRINPAKESGYTRQQMVVLIRLLLGGRARLKDIAAREMVSAPNLCATFRKLESDGLVGRTIDRDDRRNVWYFVTPAGERIARQSIEIFFDMIEQLFAGINPRDEQKLTTALKSMNDIINKVVSNNE